MKDFNLGSAISFLGILKWLFFRLHCLNDPSKLSTAKKFGDDRLYRWMMYVNIHKICLVNFIIHILIVYCIRYCIVISCTARNNLHCNFIFCCNFWCDFSFWWMWKCGLTMHERFGVRFLTELTLIVHLFTSIIHVSHLNSVFLLLFFLSQKFSVLQILNYDRLYRCEWHQNLTFF